MRLIDDWRTVLRTSSAIWTGALGGMLSTAGAYLIIFQDALDHRLLLFLAVTCSGAGIFLSSFGVAAARITKQKRISGGDDGGS